MSAFLGPVHEWLYGKIRYQNDMNDMLLEQAKMAGWGDFRAALDERTEPPVHGDLPEIIDPSNIHGWLSEQVDVAESRYAVLLTLMTTDYPERMAALTGWMAAAGAAAAAQLNTKDCVEAARHIQALLLDGMPCDAGVDFTEETAEAVCWTIRPAVHPHFTGDAYEMFADLRDAWLSGYFEGSALSCVRLDTNTWRVTKG